VGVSMHVGVSARVGGCVRGGNRGCALETPIKERKETGRECCTRRPSTCLFQWKALIHARTQRSVRRCVNVNESRHAAPIKVHP
jgi:hypothetical protein